MAIRFQYSRRTSASVSTTRLEASAPPRPRNRALPPSKLARNRALSAGRWGQSENGREKTRVSANAHDNLLSTALKLKQNQLRPRFRARSLTYASLVSGSERRPTTVAVRVRVQPFAGCRRSSSGRPALLQPTVRHGAQESAVQRKRQKQRRNPDCTSRVADTWRLLRAHCFLEPRAGVIARSAGRMIDRTTRACVPPENAVPFRTGWTELLWGAAHPAPRSDGAPAVPVPT